MHVIKVLITLLAETNKSKVPNGTMTEMCGGCISLHVSSRTYHVCYGHPPRLRPRQRQSPAIVLLVDCHLLLLQIDTGAEVRTMVTTMVRTQQHGSIERWYYSNQLLHHQSLSIIYI